MAALGEKALRMKLHADHRQFLVPDGHNFTFAVGGIRPGGNDEVGTKRVGPNNKAVITSRCQRVGKTSKDALAIVVNLVGLAMHQPFGPHDDSTRRLADGLMSQADSQ